MKVYQEQWVKRLRGNEDDFRLVSICKDIISDETGHTDELTQLLANQILRLMSDRLWDNKGE